MKNVLKDKQQPVSPRSKDEIEKQLAELRETKKKAEAYTPPDFASRMTLKSINNLEEQLLEELRLSKTESIIGADREYRSVAEMRKFLKFR